MSTKNMNKFDNSLKIDPLVAKALNLELLRQQNSIELIASENFVSPSVLAVQGSVLTNKYAEGLPSKRYYGGCEYVDMVEKVAIDRLKELFNAPHANVQPHSGASANLAVYYAMLEPGDNILGMALDQGGHLTHGSKVNVSGHWFNSHFYGVNPHTGLIDYEQVLQKAKEVKPKIIIAGASNYPRFIDFEKFRHIANEVNAYLMADIAHIAGLVIAKLHPSPFPYAHFVTSTTHKTLRGPRGGVVMFQEEFAAKIDKAVFPGLQGGPLMHVIAAKAQAFYEASQPKFIEYQKQIVLNSQFLAKALIKNGFNIVSGGTDNHLMTIDLRNTTVTGKVASEALESVNITVNKNAVPNDPQKPFVTSGIRIGTPAVTTRGMMEDEMQIIANLIKDKLNNLNDETIHNKILAKVKELTTSFPIYENIYEYNQMISKY